MSKRKREENDHYEEPSSSKEDIKITKNSLDSDDEEEDEENLRNYDINSDDETAQEASTIDYDGDIKITPFNMLDEMTEGHFDEQGSFIYKKKEDEIKDSWLENIENVKITSTQNISTSYLFKEEETFKPTLDSHSHYKAILKLLLPGESISKALQRYGKSQNIPASLRWKKKKEGQVIQANPEDKEKLNQLTSLANDIIVSGNMDIYQYTYEKLNHLVSEKDKLQNLPSSSTDDALDMFGETYDAEAAAANDSVRINETSSATKKPLEESEVMWEFKWENTEEAIIEGPHSNSQMIKWVEDGRFEKGVWVRKAEHSNADFHSSKRVDFDLYT